MSEGTGDAQQQGAQENGATVGEQTQTFTQADVDRIVKERVQREKAKYADYDDLKAKADGAKTLEERLADVENRAKSAEAAALRARVAADHGISTKRGPNGEPSDADLFLTGADEETLMAQAQRLAGREADRKKQGNVAPNEGGNPNPGQSTSDLRAFTRNLFGGAN